MVHAHFSVLRALLVVASLSSPVFSIPSAGPSSAPSKRALQDYVDNLIYIDAKQERLYVALEYGQDTYTATLDNDWSGLVLYNDSYSGSNSPHSILIGVETVEVQDGRGDVAFLEEEIEIEYFHATSWPKDWPALGYADTKPAYLGLDINNPMSPIYSYLTAKWPTQYDQWYIDLVLFYEWMNTTQSTDIDFAGIIVPGKRVDWTDLLGISSSEADSYGLPHTEGIDKQPYVYLNGDNTFDMDSGIWVNGQQTTFKSQVPKTPDGKIVAQVDLTARFAIFPDEFVKAIYGWISGATFHSESAFGYYQFDCDARVSLAIYIDGQSYVVQPEALVAPNPWGDKCVGAIMTKGQAVAAAPEFDIKIGFQLLSSFYFRQGINHDNNQPYYKFLTLDSPSGSNNTYGSSGWKTQYSTANAASTSYAATSTTSSPYGYSTTNSYYSGASAYSSGSSSYSQSTTTASVSIWTSSAASSAPSSQSSSESVSSWSSATTSWYSSASSPYTVTTASAYSSASDYNSASSGYAYPSGYSSASAGDYDESRVVTGGAAEDDASGTDGDAKTWKDKAKLYEIIIIVLAGVLGLGVVGAIVACCVGRRKKDGARASAYRSIHDAESHEPKAPLYGAEGGKSRYDDPYADHA